MCAAKIFGVEILNEGSGISIDDAVTEMSATFVARTVEPMSVVPSPFPDQGFPSFALFWNHRKALPPAQHVPRHIHIYESVAVYILLSGFFAFAGSVHRPFQASPKLRHSLPKPRRKLRHGHWSFTGLSFLPALSGDAYFCFPASVQPVRNHNRFSTPSDSLPLPMDSRVSKSNSTVRVRLTPAQINILDPGLQLLVNSYRFPGMIARNVIREAAGNQGH
jgi:hypothetical protein